MGRPRARKRGTHVRGSAVAAVQPRRWGRWGCVCLTWGMGLLAVLLSIAAAVRLSAPPGGVTGAETVRRWQEVLRGRGRLGSAPVGATPGMFTTQQFISRDGGPMTYYLYVPAQYQPARTYPVILLLHGNGETAGPGDSPMVAAQNRNLLLHQQYVQAWVTPAAQAQYPCFVVVPQAPSGDRWVDVPGSQGSYRLNMQPTTDLTTAMEIVVTVESAYTSIDRNRLYLVGISMGAYGVWDAVERWPLLFAAAAPLAGAGDPALVAAAAHVPIWDFHGADDSNMLVTNARVMYAAIHAAGGSSCSTVFPGMGHDLWNTIQVYQNARFRAWLFSQTRAMSSAEHPMACTSVRINGVPAR